MTTTDPAPSRAVPTVVGSGDEPRSGDPWWQRAVFYQIYPRSFADADGDGVGDLDGIRAHLDHLVWLGVDALWLSPFYRSPMADFGYDISDHCAVDPVFGTLDAFDRLLAEAHARGLRVIIDWVPNHTSDQHPWFEDSRRSLDARHRSWYVWRDGADGGRPPNNWVAAFDPDHPAWTFDEATDQWYLHLFEPGQPDLNWDEPATREAMHDVLRFWLDRGVDGFRADVVHCIGKDPSLPDEPADLVGIPHCALNDVPATHERLRAIRQLLDATPGERIMVGEVYLLDTERVVSYYGAGDELHLSFNFPPMLAPWWEPTWRSRMDETLAVHDARGAWPTWVLSNHDNPRHRTRYDLGAARHGEDAETRRRRSEARARAAAVLLLTLRGTPFLYQGEELGLVDADIPAHLRVDPGGRDGCRSPIPWTAGPGHGWPTTPGPWLPFGHESGTRHREAQVADPGSILHLYRRLLDLRHRVEALAVGDLDRLDLPDGVLGYRRTGPDGAWLVVVNFTGDEQVLPPSPTLAHPGPDVEQHLDGLVVAVASDGAGEGDPMPTVLGPDLALVAGPARTVAQYQLSRQ